MSVTVTAEKTVSFKSPYSGNTFQRLAEILLGQDGYISGAETSDNGSVVSVDTFVAVQRGILMQSTAAITTLPVPTAPEPWFVVAAVTDDDPDTGIIVSATAEMSAGGVVLATKNRGVWSNPNPVHIKGMAGRAAESGINRGFQSIEQADAIYELSSAGIKVGQAVDPDGFIDDVPRLASSSYRLLDLDTADILPYDGYRRRDYIVLRQIEDELRSDPARLIHLRGGMLSGASASVVEAAVGIDRAHYYARPGGTQLEQWWAWGNGTDLKIKGGVTGGFGPSVLVAGGSAITGAWICGQNAADSVVVLYREAAVLKLVSFNPATGAVVDAAVTLSAATFTGDTVRPRGLIDPLGYLHLVVEYDTGGTPSQQIYYAKYDLTTTFGAEIITPRNVNGTASGKNDTWPSLAIDRRGTVHVAHISGTGTNEYGEFVYATIVGGVTSSRTMYLPGTAVGVDPKDGSGYSADSFDNFRRTAIVVTPQDEVVALTGGTETTTSFVTPLIFSLELESRLGFAFVNFDLLATSSTFTVLALDLCAGEQGELYVSYAYRNSVGPETGIIRYTLNTRIAPEGSIDPDTILAMNGVHASGTDASVNEEACFCRPGPRGGVWDTYLFNESIEEMAGRSWSVTDPIYPTAHPADIYLAAMNVPSVAVGSSIESDSEFGIFATRPKRMSYPILVGNKGDYQGYDSLIEAVANAERFGGDVVLRRGRHIIPTDNLEIRGGGVSIRGEGSAVIDFLTPDTRLRSVGRGPGNVISISNDVVELQASSANPYIRAGDIIVMSGTGGTGLHVVLKSLGENLSVANQYRILLAQNVDGAPVGTTFTHYSSGLRLENLTLINPNSTTAALLLSNLNAITVRNLIMTGSADDDAVWAYGCQRSLIDGIDFRQLEVGGGGDHKLMLLEAGSENIVRGLRLRDGFGIQIADTEQDLHLASCHGDGSDAAKVVYNIAGTRTGPIFMTDCEGRVSGDVAWLITNVGRRVRLPEGGGALELEDDNTRASSITDDAIKLTDGSNQEFNSTTKDVVTAAVNERVKKTGDVMSGNLTTAGAGALDLGATGAAANRFNVFANTLNVLSTSLFSGAATHAANIITDGSTRDVGATGAAGNRYNIFANTLNVLDDATFAAKILTAGAAALDLGATGAAANRFNVFANTLNVLSTSEFTGAILGNLIPNATGQDIGDATHRFDAFLEAVLAYKSLGVDARSASLGANYAFYVWAPNTHVAPVADFKGRGGTPGGSETSGGGIVDSFGQFQNGVDTCTFVEDFFGDTLDTTKWTASGSGFHQIVANHTYRMEVDNGQSRLLTGLDSLWGSRQDLGYNLRMRVKISTTGSSIHYEFGWAPLKFYRGTTTWMVRAWETSGLRDYPTGVSLATGWKYFALVTNSKQRFYWSISNFDGSFDGAGGGNGVVDMDEVFAVPPTLTQKNITAYVVNTAAGADQRLEIDLIDARYRRIE